jgi:hypothetical protein
LGDADEVKGSGLGEMSCADLRGRLPVKNAFEEILPNNINSLRQMPSGS